MFLLRPGCRTAWPTGTCKTVSSTGSGYSRIASGRTRSVPLIRAALDLWGGDGGCTLTMIVSQLPAEDVRRVIEALEVRCGLRDPSDL